MSGHVSTTWAHVLLDFWRLIFIGASLHGHVLLHDSPSVRLNHNRWISLMRSTVAKSSRAYDQDQMDQNPPDQLTYFRTVWSDAPRSATSPKKHNEYISPTWKERGRNIMYIRWKGFSPLRRPLSLSTPPLSLTLAHYTCGPNWLSLFSASRHVGVHVDPWWPPWLCHVSASCHVSSAQVSAYKKPFCNFFNLLKSKNYLKNQK